MTAPHSTPYGADWNATVLGELAAIRRELAKLTDLAAEVEALRPLLDDVLPMIEQVKNGLATSPFAKVLGLR